jgi:Domain of unknown function (DUF4437)
MKKVPMSAVVFAACAAVTPVSPAVAKAKPPASHAATAAPVVMLNPVEMKWGDAPAIFPPGAKMAVIQGDPSKAGVYTVRLKAGDGYKIPAHWHPTTENVTVISGTFHVGLGDKLDESKGTTIAPQGFGSMPARVHHYAWFTGETEVQVHGMGPFTLTYVNPADTPAAARK